MLAKRGQVADLVDLEARGWHFDLKIDGVRAQAVIPKTGMPRLYSRSAENISQRYPEIVQALAEMTWPGPITLDGEIAVNDERGLPSWPLSHRRHAQGARGKTRLPATFHVFDIIDARMRFRFRRGMVEKLVPEADRVRPVLASSDGLALWQVVADYRLEGLVAKNPAGLYRPGRSSDWVKIKRTQTLTAMVGGYEAGSGSRASTVGALLLYLLRDGDLVQVGKVGSGFSDRELTTVTERIRGDQPFAVEVEYLDISPDGQLRQPVFLRLRDDATITECTYDQTEA